MANGEENESPTGTAKSSINGGSDTETHAACELPDILAAFSTEEYQRIGKNATRKLDLVIMPCLMVMYMLNNLDRNNIASAKLAGIMDDLHLSPAQYQTCISILFVGYSEYLPYSHTRISRRGV